MRPALEKSRFVRAEVNEQCDDPRKSTVKALLFPADGAHKARSGLRAIRLGEDRVVHPRPAESAAQPSAEHRC